MLKQICCIKPQVRASIMLRRDVTGGAAFHRENNVISRNWDCQPGNKSTRAFLAWCWVEVFYLNPAETNSVQQWHGKSNRESKLVTVVWDGAGIVPVPPPTMAAAGIHYTPWTSSACSVLEIFVRRERRKDSGILSCNQKIEKNT